jgi:hypothetical protein
VPIARGNPNWHPKSKWLWIYRKIDDRDASIATVATVQVYKLAGSCFYKGDLPAAPRELGE